MTGRTVSDLRNAGGFTLVEMLVALAALSILAAAGVAVTRFAAVSRDAMAVREAETRDLVRLAAVLRTDLMQAAPRRARQPGGARPQAALSGSDVFGSGVFLAFVRRGWENPSEDPRASLQYVEYALREGRIERAFRRQVDGAPLGPPLVLIEGVQGVEVGYFQFDQWVDTFAGSTERPLPRAVRLDINFGDNGRLRQDFLLPETDR